ncbi:MAG: hypothetical protein DCC49_01080 [Acidobacteria bacterium]|nr:MAG: hypothetical protein DCC49_01080 [Acidobacteriota bacterium]
MVRLEVPVHELDELLELQERDSELDRLLHRLETLEEREVAAAAAESSQSARTALDAATERVMALRREQKSLEDEIEMLTARIEEANRTLYGGTVKATRELLGIQSEIEMLEKQRSALEESAIEKLLECDMGEEARLLAQADFDSAESSLASATDRLNTAIDKLEREIKSAEEARDLARSAASALAALELYDQLRAKHGGIVISRLSDGVCGSCRLQISAVFETQLRNETGTPRCEHCSMILLP